MARPPPLAHDLGQGADRTDPGIIFPNSGAVNWPTEQVPPETLDSLRERCQAHGKKVGHKHRRS